MYVRSSHLVSHAVDNPVRQSSIAPYSREVVTVSARILLYIFSAKGYGAGKTMETAIPSAGFTLDVPGNPTHLNDYLALKNRSIGGTAVLHATHYVALHIVILCKLILIFGLLAAWVCLPRFAYIPCSYIHIYVCMCCNACFASSSLVLGRGMIGLCVRQGS